MGLALFFGVVLAVFQPSQATDAPVNRLQTPQAKAQTVKALQAMAQDRWTLARDIIAQTKDPLASKLYYWMLFKKEEGAKGQYVHLAQFIRHNPEWPGMKDMRKQAEEQMPSNLTPAEIVTWFSDYPPETARGADRYLQALFGQGKKEEAKKYLRDWWAKSSITRDEQRQIYAKYGNFIDQQAHRKRLDALLFREQYTNARGLATVLGPGYPELAEARIALAEEKGNVSALIKKVPANLQGDPGLLYERLRWRRRHDLDNDAVQILNHISPQTQEVNLEGWWQERHIMIRRLIEKKDYKTAYQLAEKHMQKDGLSYAQGEWTAGWLALRFLHNAPRALEHFEALYNNVETPMSKSRAAYWAGRAAEQMKAEAIANKWYKDAARFQTMFYGQLAGAEIGLKEALPNAAPPSISSQEETALNATEMIQAARLFHEAGLRNEASRFIQAYVKHEKTPKAYRFGAELAADMGHYHDAVKIAKDATNEGMFLTAQSYPVITNRLSQVQLEWALVHALIRQESMFDEQAQSPVGALGLMQLMPYTARDTAKKMGVAYNKSALTLRPDYNIQLGSKYLSDMLNRFDGSYPLAIAAYNAGPGRVDQWLKEFGDPRTGEVDFIDWIEMIPIYETRNYVQRVMESVYVYRLRLKGVQKNPAAQIHIAFAGRY